MPAWDDLVREFNAQPDNEKPDWVKTRLTAALAEVARLRDSNVLLYGSAFLQKPQVPAISLMVNGEDMNGFMSTIYGMDWGKPLSLLLHTPGGDPNAAGSIVAYLRSKFPGLEVIVPSFAMSAGTLISLGSDRVVMGRQSQLGPIDPQMRLGGRSVSARAVVEQFEQAKAEIKSDLTLAHVWVPILQSLGPALLQEAQNALAYSETMASTWLAQYMLDGDPDAVAKGAAIAEHFNDAMTHKSHGRRIDRDEAESVGVRTESLESSQPLQEAVLTAYHLMTILFTRTPCARLIWSHAGSSWVKNHATAPAIKP